MKLASYFQSAKGWKVMEGNLGFPPYVYWPASRSEVTERNLGSSLFLFREVTEP